MTAHAETAARRGALYRVILPYPPSSNRYWRMVNGHPTLSREARAYREQAGWAFIAAYGRPQLSGPVALTLIVYRPRRVGDLTNRIKILEDALNAIAWLDDAQTVELHAYLRDDKTNPRVEVEIRTCLAVVTDG